MTLRELIESEGKAFPIKVLSPKSDIPLTIHGISEYADFFIAENPGGIFSLQVGTELHGWRLYFGPKKKVIKWLWSYYDSGYESIVVSKNFYTEYEASKQAFQNPLKLEWSKTEFEVDS